MMTGEKKAPDHSRKPVNKEVHAGASQNHELISFPLRVERKTVGI